MAFLEVIGLSKNYGGVPALQDVDFSAEAGEVHALVGANGAGKSTLMNILAGAVAPTSGGIRIGGEAVAFGSPRAAQQAGISTVYQEFSLVPSLSVARNIFLGREPRNRWRLVDGARLRTQTRALLDRYGIRLDPEAPVEALSVAQQQLVEIARALSFDARILILDEPTAVLSLNEQKILFDIIARLKREGLLVLYVSHRLEEIFAIADWATVLRDGRKVGTIATGEADQLQLVRMMIGRDARQGFALPEVDRSAPPLVGLSYRLDGRENRITAHTGEILGIAGFVGSGRTSLALSAIGARQGLPLELTLGGKAERIASPAQAMRAGLVYMTEDRKRDGLFASLSVLNNATASVLGSLGHGGLITRRREREAAGGLLEKLRLVAASLEMPVRGLSGGNQQKVVLGRALLRRPRVLICDEPTRGIDVGAKDEIYDLLIGLASQGIALVIISSEVKELLAITHHIYVMRDRHVVAEFATRDTDEGRILLAATGAPSELRDAA